MIYNSRTPRNGKPPGDYDIILNAPKKKADWRTRGIKSPKGDWRVAGILGANTKGVQHDQ